MLSTGTDSHYMFSRSFGAMIQLLLLLVREGHGMRQHIGYVAAISCWKWTNEICCQSIGFHASLKSSVHGSFFEFHVNRIVYACDSCISCTQHFVFHCTSIYCFVQHALSISCTTTIRVWGSCSEISCILNGSIPRCLFNATPLLSDVLLFCTLSSRRGYCVE